MLICDDHEPFREGLHTLLDTEPDVTVVGEAIDGQSAIHTAPTLQPDVILMDLNMPGIGGIEATRQILQASPQISILVLTMSEDNDSVFAALQAGARGYLLKGARKADIIHAIRGVDSGGAIFGPTIAKRLRRIRHPTTAAPHNTFPQFTSRENEILDLSRATSRTQRSPTNSNSNPKQSATTCPTSSTKCKSPPGPKPSSPPVTPDLDSAAHP